MRILLPLLAVGLGWTLDVSGQPDWLDHPLRADWRGAPLSEVIEQIRKEIARPVDVSTGVSLRAADAVTLRDRKKGTVRSVLEALEDGQELACAAEPQFLRIRTAEERQVASRRLVEIDLRRYGSYVEIRDFPLSGIGLQTGPDRTSQATSGSQAASAGVVERDAGAAMHGNARLQLTPEEERETRRRLGEHLALAARRSTGTITCGWLPAATPVATGLVSRAIARRIAGGLEGSRRLALEGLAGQLVSAQRLAEQGRIEDLEVVASMHDPTTAVLRTGLAASLRCLPGQASTLVSWQFAWVEPLPSTPRAMRKPERRFAEQNIGKDQGAPPPPVDPGDSIEIDLDACWAWRQAGESILGPDQALVLVTQREERRAVTILEVAP